MFEDHPTATDVLAERSLWSIEQADCLEFLRALPEGSVDLLFCSGPYEKARLYLEEGKNLGIARDTDEWVAWMVEVCEAARHACKGLCAFVVEGQTRDYRYSCAPFLLLADLHRSGFHLRKPPVYRRVGIPGSGGPDWLRNDWEPIVCFARGGRLPWSDSTACGSPPVYGPGGAMSHRLPGGERVNGGKTRRDKRVSDGRRTGNELQGYRPPHLANPGNIIDCDVGGGMMGSQLAHANEAPFPQSLATFFVRSFCPPCGIVCDPFAGSGTTAAAALDFGRRFIGCDLRPSQVALTRRRILETNRPLFSGM